MNKTAQYNTFEQGFLKEAAQHGCDTSFLEGYISQADEIVDIWKEAFDQLAEASGDPQYKIKLANELVYFSIAGPELIKEAAGEDFQNFLGEMGGKMPWLGQANEWLQGGGLGDTIGNTVKSNPNLLSSLITGGGGGGLLGLLLGALTGHPMIGMMLGGLGGAGVGAFMGNKGLQDSFGGLFKRKPNGQSPKIPKPIDPPIDPREPMSNYDLTNSPAVAAHTSKLNARPAPVVSQPATAQPVASPAGSMRMFNEGMQVSNNLPNLKFTKPPTNLFTSPAGGVNMFNKGLQTGNIPRQ